MIDSTATSPLPCERVLIVDDDFEVLESLGAVPARYLETVVIRA